MRNGIADADGKCVGYDYITQIVDIKLENESPLCRPEIVGGEWLDKVYNNDILKDDTPIKGIKTI